MFSRFVQLSWENRYILTDNLTYHFIYVFKVKENIKMDQKTTVLSINSKTTITFIMQENENDA